MLLALVAGLTAALAVAAGWTRTQLLDEDTWAATSAALVRDPQVQEDVADAIAEQVVAAVGVQDALEGLLPGPLDQLADPVAGRATDLVAAATLQAVRTDTFVEVWDTAVRASHGELVAALEDEGTVTSVGPEGMCLELGPGLVQLRQLLSERGVTFLDGIDLSGVQVRLLLVDAPGLERVRQALDVLDVLVVALPAAAAVCAVAGLVVARRRSLAVAAGGVGALVGAAAVAAVVAAGEAQAVRHLTGGVLGEGAARAVVDHVTSSLDGALLVVAAVGGVLVVAGGVAAAVSARR